mgnify:CR=1 FL=1
MKSRAKVIRQKHIREIPRYGNSKGWYIDPEKEEDAKIVNKQPIKTNRSDRRKAMRQILKRKVS